MPWTWLRVLPLLSSSSAPQLTACLMVLGVVLLTAADRRLAVLAFLLLRTAALLLLWPAIRGTLGTVSAAGHLAIALICATTECRLRQVRDRAAAHPSRHEAFLMTPPFRALAAALGLLLSHGFVQTYARDLAPRTVALATSWLAALGMLALLFSTSGLGTAMGAVVLADGFRILYAVSRPSAWAWALWTVCDVLVVLASARLSRVEAAIGQGSAKGRS